MVAEMKYPSSKGEITVYKIVNSNGSWVELSNLGAGIISVNVPDKDNKIENVALRYKNPKDYLYDGPCMGKVPGRYANRIAKGELHIDGKDYQLAVNNGPNALHGGPEGFQNRIWDSEIIPNGVRFTYVSKDSEENYPGELKAVVEYLWTDDNELIVKFEASTDKDTVVNLTNHTYWNLKGSDAGNVLDHKMKIKASEYLPTDESLVPTGVFDKVAGTPMDFTGFKALGRDIKADFPALKFGKGYDNCWKLDNWTPGKMIEDAVELTEEVSGRSLRVSTDQPGVQVYTGNWLAGSPENMSEKGYEDYDGVAIEAQGFPDAPNKPGFPSQYLRPGEKYQRTIRFAFSK